MKGNSRQALVADIGGTHARFAISDIDELTVTNFAVFRCNMFTSLKAAIEAYMGSVPHRPAMASFAIAGPVTEGELRLTNLPWSFTRDDLRRATGAERLHVVNDFEALALSLPYLTAHDLHKLGGGEPAEGRPRVVLGPGTGLGVAGLVAAPSGWVGMPTEGGHVSFPVESGEELEIVEQIRAGEGHLSAERLISGPGLSRLYAALAKKRGRHVEPRSVQEIVERGLAKEDPLAELALQLFVKWLGRFAGDVALLYGAGGGVYLGGGIAPRILDLLATDAFRGAFLSKGRLFSFLERLPVQVIKSQDAGLRGAAVALSAAIPV
ncbi:glucokinase [Chelativorans xinjiangense]|uniref:glucokinase n=1 Tax=Chelativorans xinjiangense TaxID=2681485 RepID=UPI001359E859|nr:glucokinase [Chelativorans xinjiangense]